MANTTLFASTRGPVLPAATTHNEAGGLAYARKPQAALALYAATGCFNGTFYASAETQLDRVLTLCAQVEPGFVARTAIYARQTAHMKVMPALLLASLSVRDRDAFAAAFPGFGDYFLSVALAVFAFTTILGWAYYGEKCWEFLIGGRVRVPYRVLWTLFVMVGAVAKLDFVWLLADTMNAFMAFPNLVSLLLLSPIVVKASKDYFNRSPVLANAAAFQR